MAVSSISKPAQGGRGAKGVNGAKGGVPLKIRRFLSPPHRCYANGCSIQIGGYLLLCRDHWRMLSRPLQAKVSKTYLAVCEDRYNPILRKAYQDAIDEARAAIARLEEANHARG